MYLSPEDLDALGVGEPPAYGRMLVDGPWQSGFCVATQTPVRSKSNFRFRQHSGQRWDQVREFESHMRRIFADAKPDTWPSLGETDQVVAVDKRPKIIGAIYARSLLDAPNLPKSLYDAAEGVLYRHDSVVRSEMSIVERRRSPLLVAGFAALEAETTLEDWQKATTVMAAHVVALANWLRSVETA